MSFFPARLKIKELAYWHIEREEPHRHEYFFAGEISIIPRNPEAIPPILAVYLQLSKDMKVNASRTPFDTPFDGSYVPPVVNVRNPIEKKIVGTYVFTLKWDTEIKVPPYAFVIMQFKGGKAIQRVSLREDAKYGWELVGE